MRFDDIREDTDVDQDGLLLTEKSVSRKHLTISVERVKPGDGV